MGLLGGKKADLNDPGSVWEEVFRVALKSEWGKTLSLLDTLMKLEPQNPQVYMKSGDILQRTGKPEQAVEAYHRAAAMLDEEDETGKALAVYKVILRLAPKDEKAGARVRDLIKRMSSAAVKTEGVAPAVTGAEEGAGGGLSAQGPGGAPDGAGPSVKKKAPAPDEAPVPKAAAAGPVSLKEAFARHPIFSVITDDEIKFISQKAGHLSFSDGQPVIEEDSPGDSIYVIKKGRASVTTTVAGSTLNLASLGGLAFFGEGGFLTGAPRTATVTASGQLEVMEIPKALMSELIIKNPQVLGKLVELLRYRASRTKEAQG